MLDFNIITGIGVAAALVLAVVFLFPYLRKQGVTKDLYKDIKMGLMVFGYAFRDDKVKQITAMMLAIVTSVEKLDIASEDKKQEALEVAFKEMMEQLNIVLDPEALSLIIDIAVSYLPPTNENID